MAIAVNPDDCPSLNPSSRAFPSLLHKPPITTMSTHEKIRDRVPSQSPLQSSPNTQHPPSVHFNSTGATIVEDSIPNSDGQANDIYFPHHTAEVSHIAVDVFLPKAKRLCRLAGHWRRWSILRGIPGI